MGQVRKKELFIVMLVGAIVIGGGLLGWGHMKEGEEQMGDEGVRKRDGVRILGEIEINTQQITEKDTTQSATLPTNDQLQESPSLSSEPDPTQSTKLNSQSSSSSTTIQFIQQSKPYHIYSAMNPRLVLDVAKADDGSHDLILYQWQNTLNQEYYFKRVHGNFYHIINAESNQHMKKSQKVILSTGVSKVKFQQQQDGEQLWQLVPGKKNSNNSFFILSSQRLALDLNEGYATNGAQIILYEWSKNDNQVWFLRQNNPQFLPQQSNKQHYQERLAELLIKAMSVPDSVNQCITFEEMKKEMTGKNMVLPEWVSRPKMGKPELYDMPPQISASYHQLEKNKELKRHQYSQQSQTESPSQQSQQIKPNQHHVDFKPQNLALQCAKNHTIAYIWYGDKQMPSDYQQLIQRCKSNVHVLNENDFSYYVQKWNIIQPFYSIDIDDYIIRQRINLLKLLYLYFQSGIYADFDTQINQECFENVFADQIIWTSRLDEDIKDNIELALQEIVVPEESFMMITTKQHPQVKRMLQEEIMEHNQRGGHRWKECSYRQCLIIQCQRHYRDNTYKKGFD